jgi:hypothetical protein
VGYNLAGSENNVRGSEVRVPSAAPFPQRISAFASGTTAFLTALWDGAVFELRWEQSGAAYVTRTRDPIITNDVLYRLS